MDAKKAVEKAFEKALTAQQPFAKNNVERLRRVHPDDTPSDMARRLDRYFLTAVTTSGATAGGVGAVPGAGIPAGLADVLSFTEASVLYVLSLAEVHRLHPEDIERRKALLYTVMIGDSAIGAFGKFADKSGTYWAKKIVESIPMKAINSANKVLGPRFITKYGTKQGVLVLSKQVPMGIGVALGGGANHVVGRGTVRSAHKIFGAAPKTWGPAPPEAGGAPSGVLV